mmetsp:Transcript_28503/g.93131  ORF Transcript_28503/g.93131 Transcript_28503/m.93131 type:complete len:219 (-) Transcript_28503:105-761(-)
MTGRHRRDSTASAHASARTVGARSVEADASALRMRSASRASLLSATQIAWTRAAICGPESCSGGVGMPLPSSTEKRALVRCCTYACRVPLTFWQSSLHATSTIASLLSSECPTHDGGTRLRTTDCESSWSCSTTISQALHHAKAPASPARGTPASASAARSSSAVRADSASAVAAKRLRPRVRGSGAAEAASLRARSRSRRARSMRARASPASVGLRS